jgi:hypothetical protein
MMDPEANRREQLGLAREIVAAIDRHADPRSGRPPVGAADRVGDLAERLAGLVIALAEWRASGGFEP